VKEPTAPARPLSRAEAYMDPYRPLPPAPTPGTGTADPREAELSKEAEPAIPGTLFLTTILLMIIAGIWIVMFIILLGR
jgi:hypothetical protein